MRRLEVIQQGCLEVQQLVPQLYAQGINPILTNIRQFIAKPSALLHGLSAPEFAV
ncbi:MAG: hypothetical protein PUP91_03060 [Rhizonema sp. PD37]|nr:hypothetical protein [Rhizonema sp. PD37]